MHALTSAPTPHNSMGESHLAHSRKSCPITNDLELLGLRFIPSPGQDLARVIVDTCCSRTQDSQREDNVRLEVRRLRRGLDEAVAGIETLTSGLDSLAGVCTPGDAGVCEQGPNPDPGAPLD